MSDIKDKLTDSIFNAIFDDDDLTELKNKRIIAQKLGYKLSVKAAISCELDCVDHLEKENAQLKSQLHDLFEHVSGVSVNEYKQEQMQYLADYIIGQAESDNMCIEKLKAGKAELVDMLNFLACTSDMSDSVFTAVNDLIQKTQGATQ